VSPDTLDIDAHGRVLPHADEARRRLADRAGRFVLLPSSPDLLVARRKPAAGGAAPRPRCVLAGDLSAFPIADFIAFVHQSRLSGLLTASTGCVDRVLAFREGAVRGARSEAAGERIGEIAVRLGFVSAEQHAEAEQAVAASGGVLFGKILVQRGFLTPPALWKCLHEQVAAVFHAILMVREGVFTMVDDADVDLGTPLAVDTQSLLMDGIRRIDETSLFRARIPGPKACLRRRAPRSPITLQPLERSLLDLVDGRRTVAEIAQGAHVSEFDATKILYHLAEAGYVEAMSAATSPALSTPERLLAITAGMNAILAEIIAALPGAAASEPFLAGTRAFLADPASRFAPLWRMVLPGRDGSVDVATLLGNAAALRGEALTRLEASGDPARIVFDALRELMFFYLFQAGERLSRDADERLALAVKQRFDAFAEFR
jgi:hypothetical protein